MGGGSSFNPPTSLSLASSERLMASSSDKGGVALGGAGADAPTPFPSMPFFMPSMNGAAMPGLAANGAMASQNDRSGSMHAGHCPTESPAKQREGQTANGRNGNRWNFRPEEFLCLSFSSQLVERTLYWSHFERKIPLKDTWHSIFL